MTGFVWLGTCVGALLGTLHAVYVYQRIAAEPPAAATANSLRPATYAAWTLGLWILFGSYLLGLWLAGVVFYAVFKAFR